MNIVEVLDSPQWRAAQTWLASDGVQPPLLISGANNDVLQNIINELALHAVCTSKENVPCRSCKNCHQAITKIHPDIITYTPSTLTIPIKDIRTLMRKLSRTAMGKHRLVVINDIHKLSIPSAHALLKALEEPSTSTRYILVTAWPQRLLPTILSRCQQLRFHINQDAETIKNNSSAPWKQSLLQRLASYDGKQALDESVLHGISDALTEQLRASGPTPELRRALLRLRDYYRIVGTRGNEKFARDVLLSSLPN